MPATRQRGAKIRVAAKEATPETLPQPLNRRGGTRDLWRAAEAGDQPK